jgi:ATP-dependent RNA helicase A
VDVNAGIHGNWTMENAKSMLHQFIQMRHIKTDYKYAMQGTSFVAEMSFYVKVRYVILDRVVWICIDLMLMP